MEQKRYKTRPGKRLTVRGRLVTDAAAGTLLPVAAAAEHVRCGRLVEAAAEAEDNKKPARKRGKEE